MAAGNCSTHKKQGTVLLTIGAAFCGMFAGAFTTLLFLWVYGFDTYRSAFYSRSIPVLSMDFKFILLSLSSLVWFLIFLKWVFKRTEQAIY